MDLVFSVLIVCGIVIAIGACTALMCKSKSENRKVNEFQQPVSSPLERPIFENIPDAFATESVRKCIGVVCNHQTNQSTLVQLFLHLNHENYEITGFGESQMGIFRCSGSYDVDSGQFTIDFQFDVNHPLSHQCVFHPVMAREIAKHGIVTLDHLSKHPLSYRLWFQQQSSGVEETTLIDVVLEESRFRNLLTHTHDTCLNCFQQPYSVVLLPCEHLYMCRTCFRSFGPTLCRICHTRIEACHLLTATTMETFADTTNIPREILIHE